MNPEERKMLDEALLLARENNKILHGIRRGNRWSMFFTLAYWILILGSLGVGFYFAKPYIDLADQSYSQIKSQLDGLKSATDKIPNINNILR